MFILKCNICDLQMLILFISHATKWVVYRNALTILDEGVAFYDGYARIDGLLGIVVEKRENIVSS